MEHNPCEFRENKNSSKFAVESLSLSLGYNTLSHHILVEILIMTIVGPCQIPELVEIFSIFLGPEIGLVPRLLT